MVSICIHLCNSCYFAQNVYTMLYIQVYTLKISRREVNKKFIFWVSVLPSINSGNAISCLTPYSRYQCAHMIFKKKEKNPKKRKRIGELSPISPQESGFHPFPFQRVKLQVLPCQIQDP